MLLAILLACPKEGAPEEAHGSTVGWTIERGWTGACFVPPDFSTLEGEVRAKQEQNTMDALVGQWTGERNDGVSFDANAAKGVREMLPAERIGDVAAENLAFCRDAMSGEATTTSWGTWLEELHAELKEESCPDPLEDTYLTLDVRVQWFAEVPICAGDAWFLKAESDEYRVRADGPTHTVAGTEGDASSLPCPDCPVGALIVRFEGEDGSTAVMLAGTSVQGVAPVAGRLRIGLNDDDFSDNAYRVQGGVKDSVGIQVGPRRSP